MFEVFRVPPHTADSLVRAPPPASSVRLIRSAAQVTSGRFALHDASSRANALAAEHIAATAAESFVIFVMPRPLIDSGMRANRMASPPNSLGSTLAIALISSSMASCSSRVARS
jgi:hypothetical protein